MTEAEILASMGIALARLEVQIIISNVISLAQLAAIFFILFRAKDRL